MARVGLGTVQFGIPYGNQKDSALMSIDEVNAIVRYALSRGIHDFDTAAAYGESEFRLGQISELRNSEVDIVTKIPRVAAEVWANADQYTRFVLDHAHASLKKLHKTSFKTLFFHQCEVDFLSSRSFQVACRALCEEKICDHLGVSVYFPEEASCCESLGFISALQVPVNLIDTRFVTGPLIERLQQKKMTLVARSIVLQGIFVSGAPLPPVKKISALKDLRTKAERIASIAGVDLQTLSFAQIFDRFDNVLDVALLGVDSLKSLQQNLDVIQQIKNASYTQVLRQFTELENEVSQLQLNNPATWDRE